MGKKTPSPLFPEPCLLVPGPAAALEFAVFPTVVLKLTVAERVEELMVVPEIVEAKLGMRGLAACTV